MEVIVRADGSVVGTYHGDAAIILARYLEITGQDGYVTRLIPPDEAELTVEHVMRAL